MGAAYAISAPASASLLPTDYSHYAVGECQLGEPSALGERQRLGENGASAQLLAGDLRERAVDILRCSDLDIGQSQAEILSRRLDHRAKPATWNEKGELIKTRDAVRAREWPL